MGDALLAERRYSMIRQRQQQQYPTVQRALLLLLLLLSDGTTVILSEASSSSSSSSSNKNNNIQSQSQGSVGLEYTKHASVVKEFPSLTKFLEENDNIQSSGLFDLGSYLIVDVVRIKAVCDQERTECKCSAQLLHPNNKNVVCHSCTVRHYQSQNPAFGATVDCTKDDPTVPNCSFQCDTPEIEFHYEQMRKCGLHTCLQLTDDQDGDDDDDDNNNVLVEWVETPDGPVRKDSLIDTNGDGIPDMRDEDGDGTGDVEYVHWVETPSGPVRADRLIDTNGDGIPDMIDEDGDGVGDVEYDSGAQGGQQQQQVLQQPPPPTTILSGFDIELDGGGGGSAPDSPILPTTDDDFYDDMGLSTTTITTSSGHHDVSINLHVETVAHDNLLVSDKMSLVKDFDKLHTFLETNPTVQELERFDYGRYTLLDILEVRAVCDPNRITCLCQATFKGQSCPLCGVRLQSDSNPALGADVDCSGIDASFPTCAFTCENPLLEEELIRNECGLDTCVNLREETQPEYVPMRKSEKSSAGRTSSHRTDGQYNALLIIIMTTAVLMAFSSFL